MKKQMLCLTALAFLLGTTSVYAATTTTPAPAPTTTPQQNRMKTCAAQYHAKNIPKSQYKSFMSGCLKNPATAPAATKTAPAKTAL